MKFTVPFISTALFVASLTVTASAASCSSTKVNGGATNCAKRIADRMCSQIGCGGRFDQAAGPTVHVQGVMSNGACPRNCASAVENILNQCIENRWNSGSWESGGEWYWIYSTRNSDAGSGGC